jgi:cAMP-binding proteins - catabolite gene activator and regulatory subunit of cAMP-dependent protein kinases
MLYCQTMTTLEELRRIPLFAALDDRTLTDTARYMQARTYRPGEYITYEGERAAGVYFVQRGRVRLSRTAPDGREQVLAMVGAGENLMRSQFSTITAT